MRRRFIGDSRWRAQGPTSSIRSRRLAPCSLRVFLRSDDRPRAGDIVIAPISPYIELQRQPSA